MNSFRWSCSERSFPLAPLPVAFKIIAGLRFDAVDLSISDRSRHLPRARVLADPRTAAEELRQQLDERALQVSDVRLDVPLRNGAGEAALLEFTRRCGASHATLLWSAEEGVDTWRPFVDRALEAGIQPAVEACEGTPAERIRSLAAQVRGLSITLDYGVFLAGGTAEEELYSLLPFVSHVRVRGASPGVFQVAWRENAVDYRRSVDALRANRYEGFLAADYVWEPESGRNRNDAIAETVQMRRWFDQTC
jgi:sugar phosphate isomerase/epimerase